MKPSSLTITLNLQRGVGAIVHRAEHASTTILSGTPIPELDAESGEMLANRSCAGAEIGNPQILILTVERHCRAIGDRSRLRAIGAVHVDTRMVVHLIAGEIALRGLHSQSGVGLRVCLVENTERK